MKLSATEKKILTSAERDEWRSVHRLKHERTRYVSDREGDAASDSYST